jgi:glycosyltransferase involved in cell wall biosynthesis
LQERRTIVERAEIIGRQRISVVVPCYNEGENLPELLKDLQTISSRYAFYEVVLVDDGSTDGTYGTACELAKQYGFLQVARHLRNFGLTMALNTGFAKCRGDIIVFWPGDLQFHAEDIPRLTEPLVGETYMVCRYKKGKYSKKLISAVYNYLTRLMFHISVRDQNSVKAFRKEILDALKLRSSWHRYIAAIAAFYGYGIAEVPVTLYPRRHGKSKFITLFRIIVGLLDLISVKIELDFSVRPMLLMGLPGMVLSTISAIIGVSYFILKALVPIPVETKLTILLGISVIFIVGVILVCFGIISDVLRGIVDRQIRRG